MIVGARPRFRQIIIEVWKPLTILFVWDVAVTAFHMMTPIKEPPLPTALFGTAIALFMGFRTNAAYARWWEARTLWGALINASRSLARITRSLTKGEPEGSETRHNIILRQIAFRSEEHTSELQSLMRISYAVFCFEKKKKKKLIRNTANHQLK